MIEPAAFRSGEVERSVERDRPAADGVFDPCEEGVGPIEAGVRRPPNIGPVRWCGTRARPVVLVGVEAHRQRGEPQLENDLIGRRGDLVGTGEGGAGPLPVALPERQLGLPCGAHTRGVVVGAERVGELCEE